MKRLSTLLLVLAIAMAAQAQQALDFVGKFMTCCEGDTTVKCVTVSPKMMEQITQQLQSDEDGGQEIAAQAIAKLKSARIVSAAGQYYERAEQLIKKHARRFKAEQDFQTDNVRGTFYTRQNRKGETVELILLRQDNSRDLLNIICLTGRIDKEFLCFLYNKSFKN